MSGDTIGFYFCGCGSDSSCPHTKYGPGSVDQNNALGEWLKAQDKLRARDSARLAAVRELVSDCLLTGEWSLDVRKMAIEKLKAVWPEAVEEKP